MPATSDRRRTGQTIGLSLAYIVGAGAVASYWQALAVVQAADGRTAISYFVAGLADPTIFAASANLLDAYRQKTRLPKWSMLSVAVALAVTIGANVAAGAPHSVPPWLVRVWPPVAFLMALESLMSYTKRGRSGVSGNGIPLTAGQDQPGEPPEPPTTDEVLALLLRTDSRRGLGETLGVGKYRVDKWAARLAESGPATPAVARDLPPVAATAGHLNGQATG